MRTGRTPTRRRPSPARRLVLEPRVLTLPSAASCGRTAARPRASARRSSARRPVSGTASAAGGVRRTSRRACTLTSLETSPPETARNAPLAGTPVSVDQPPPFLGQAPRRGRGTEWEKAALLELHGHLLVRSAIRHRSVDNERGLVGPWIVGRTAMVIAAGATTSRAICSSALPNISAVGSLAKVTLASTL